MECLFDNVEFLKIFSQLLKSVLILEIFNSKSRQFVKSFDVETLQNPNISFSEKFTAFSKIFFKSFHINFQQYPNNIIWFNCIVIKKKLPVLFILIMFKHSMKEIILPEELLVSKDANVRRPIDIAEIAEEFVVDFFEIVFKEILSEHFENQDSK